MIKTNKGVRTLAVTLAFLMIACFVPTLVMASATVTATASYNEATEIVTVTGNISTPGADVTILVLGAVSANEKLEDIIGDEEDNAVIASKIVYIDQETSDEEGNFEFKFKRRAGVSGAFVNINVGGEGVTEPYNSNLEAVPTGPVLDVVSAYYGSPIELEFEAGESWTNAITSIKVDNTEYFENGAIVVPGTDNEPGTITLPPVTYIETKTVDVVVRATDFKDSEVTVTLSLREAGTITAAETVLVADVDDAVFTLADNADEDWIEKVETAVKVDGVPVSATVEGTTLTIDKSEFALSNEDEQKTFAVTVEAEYYTVPSAITLTVKAPTFAVKLPASVSVDHVSHESDPEQDTASVTIPEIAETYGTTVVWKLDGEVVTGTVNLDRPAVGEAAVTRQLTVSVTKGDFKEATKTYTLTVQPKGVAGVEVKVKLTNIAEAALALAEVMIGDYETSRVGDTFTSVDPIPAGEYEVVITRPGFVTMTVSVEVADEDMELEDVKMIPGDVNGDGDVTLADFNQLKAQFMTKKATAGAKWNDAIDFNGDEEITLADFNLLKNNFGHKSK